MGQAHWRNMRFNLHVHALEKKNFNLVMFPLDSREADTSQVQIGIYIFVQVDKKISSVDCPIVQSGAEFTK